MTVKRRFSYIASLSLTLSLCSCAATRVFSTDKSDYISPEKLDSIYKPDGKLEEVYYDTSVEGPSRRRMLVYLPASYDGVKRFPVIYVLHGARGNESTWITKGDMLTMVDSLQRNGLAVPSIYVLPNVNQYDDDEDYGQSRFKNPFESFFETNGAVESSFVDDVVKNVDSLYLTIPDKGHRAIAGMSVGGFQTIFITAHHPDVFDYVGLFSPFCRGPVRNGRYSSFYKNLEKLQVEQFSRPPKVYMIGIGFYDFFLFHNDLYRIYLQGRKYPYQYFETAGGHEWYNWKEYLSEFATRCFR